VKNEYTRILKMTPDPSIQSADTRQDPDRRREQRHQGQKTARPGHINAATSSRISA
jgi:hypothetical protein